jgi:hypothetical protein
MKIVLQNTLLSGGREGRTINAHEDDGREVLLANVLVARDGDAYVLTVVHHSHRWESGVGSTASGPTELAAAEAIVQQYLSTLSG